MTSKRRKMNEQKQTPSSAAAAAAISEPQQQKNSYLINNNESATIFKSDYSKQLLTKLNQTRNDSTLCDYEIRCNSRVFNAHKCILMSVSDFFKAMLTGSMKESRENFVELKGFTSTIGVEQMIEFAYTGILKITFDTIVDLLNAASHLQIHDALVLINEFIIQNCTQKNCVNLLKIADRFALNQVETNINEYMAKNFINIYQQEFDQFLQLSKEQIIQQLNSSNLQMCPESDLFLIVCKWIESDRSKRLPYAPEILKYIRFMTMSSYELADYVERVDFMRTIPECYRYLVDAYRYHALPLRQPIIFNDQAKLRNKPTLVAVGENNLFVLNETKQKWETICTAPLEENYPYPFATITFNNYLYVIGTRRSASEEYRNCYRFSPHSLEWTQLAPLLHDRSRFGASVVENYIYIFGGFEGFKRSNRVYLNTIHRYSIEIDKWEEYSTEGPQMSSMAACTYKSLIYFGGGKNANWNKVSDFYSINAAEKQIVKRANMLTARTTHQIAVCNDRIIVIGGFDDTGNGILSIESYDSINDQWSVITNIPGSISKTWPQSVGVLNGTKFYISVFHTPNTFKIIQKGYFYDLKSNIWSDAPVVHERSRYCPTCCLSFPRKIYNSNGIHDEVVVQHQNTSVATTTTTNDYQQTAAISTNNSPSSSVSMKTLILEDDNNDINDNDDDDDDDDDGGDHDHNQNNNTHDHNQNNNHSFGGQLEEID